MTRDRQEGRGYQADAAIDDAVMALPPDERRNRAKVNKAVRNARRKD